MASAPDMGLPFRAPYNRPTRLSDPYRHFSPHRLKSILQTSDETLSWSDFREIFHFGTPAGTYEEIVYFLPFALRFMRLSPRDALEFMSGMCCVIADNVQRLDADSLLRPTIEAVADSFRAWTKAFVVIHYDAEACRTKGWTIDHQDIVVNSQEVSELLADLWRYPALHDLGDRLIADLAHQHDDHWKSAWFLEYARATLQGYATWP